MKDRWLLPFTHGVNVRALEQVVHLAEVGGAQLVPVALIPVKQRSSGVRLEHIQQAKDFLEAVRCKAIRHQVPVECHEIFTSDVSKCITQLIQDLHCESIVLVTSEQQGLLLQTEEVTCLLTNPPATLVLVRLPGHQRDAQIAHPVMHLMSWLRQSHRHQSEGWQKENPVTEEDLSSPSRT